jgi:hypothetical protein
MGTKQSIAAQFDAGVDERSFLFRRAVPHGRRQLPDHEPALPLLFDLCLLESEQRQSKECEMRKIKWTGTFTVTAAATLVAVFFASRGMPAQSASATRIAVAAVDIDVGQRLAPRFIKLIDWPAGKIPPGAFSDTRQLAGRVLRASLLHGEPLTESRLQPAGPTAVSAHLADLVVLAAAGGDARPFMPARRAGLPMFSREKRPGVRDFDPETRAWLALLGDPWAQPTPTSVRTPPRA